MAWTETMTVFSPREILYLHMKLTPVQEIRARLRLRLRVPGRVWGRVRWCWSSTSALRK